MPEVRYAEQAARDLAQSLRVCAKEGYDLAEIELEGQLAKYLWLATPADRESFAWLDDALTASTGQEG
jgi:hypothetical protein